MPDKKGLQLTNGGLNALAMAVAGYRLEFTRVAFGDSVKNGATVYPAESQILNFTKLIHEIPFTLPLTDIKFTGSGTATIRFLVDNSNLAEGFFAREIGLFAKDPSTSQEILYAYKNTGDASIFIEGGGGSVVLKFVVNLVTIIGQATDVTAKISGDVLFVTESDLLTHINSSAPHPNAPNRAAELSGSDFVWVAGSDFNLHPLSISNLSVLLLGETGYSLPLLNSKISQVENNLANLYMQLGSQSDSRLDANLFLAEDFTDCKCIDRFQVKVLQQANGTNSVTVESIDGILEGHYYTLSDGVHSQFARVRALADNDGVCTVIFDSNFKYTFNLDKATLYRTTGFVQNNQLKGASDVRSAEFFVDSQAWQGYSASSSATLSLTTTLKNAANFTLSGDFSFNSNGEFTIN